jgi:hypothetical protein
MRRILLAVALVILSLAPSVAQTDHLQCFKIKDTAAKTTYTADLSPSDPGFPVAVGCRLKVPARMLCIDVQKGNVAPPPPGAAVGAPTHKFLCYKVKCPKVTPAATLQDQFGTHPVTVKSTSLLCAPVPVPTTTTTTTTTLPCPDADMDGFQAPPCGGDCNDSNPAINPMATISCGVGACQNTVPSCVGLMQNTCTPGMPTQEICSSGIDEDCDGTVDESQCTCTFAGQCPAPPNATPGCNMGVCGIGSCSMGYANCNNMSGDGCEVFTQSNVSNCGSCGLVCQTFPNTQPACVNAMCTFTCNAGFFNCDGMTPNGCEVNTTNDPLNCGACASVCPISNPNCVNSVCVP